MALSHPDFEAGNTLSATPTSLTLPPRRLSTVEAAAYLGVSPSFLTHDRIGQRRIPFAKIGAAVRYDSADLDRFLARCKCGAEAA